MPQEPALLFYPCRIGETIPVYGWLELYGWRIHRMRKRLQKDPSVKKYIDLAITPVIEEETEDLEMFRLNNPSVAAVDIAKRQADARRKHEADKASAA